VLLVLAHPVLRSHWTGIGKVALTVTTRFIFTIHVPSSLGTPMIGGGSSSELSLIGHVIGGKDILCGGLTRLTSNVEARA
jgi:hypothetical protein